MSGTSGIATIFPHLLPEAGDVIAVVGAAERVSLEAEVAKTPGNPALPGEIAVPSA